MLYPTGIAFYERHMWLLLQLCSVYLSLAALDVCTADFKHVAFIRTLALRVAPLTPRLSADLQMNGLDRSPVKILILHSL